MENVPRLTLHRVFEKFVSRLEACGYAVTKFLARGPDYGIPQRRVRLVVLASRYSPIELTAPGSRTNSDQSQANQGDLPGTGLGGMGG